MEPTGWRGGGVAVGGSRFFGSGRRWRLVNSWGRCLVSHRKRTERGKQLKPWPSSSQHTKREAEEKPPDSHGPTLAPPSSCSCTSLADSRSSLQFFLFFWRKYENFDSKRRQLGLLFIEPHGKTPLLPNVPHTGRCNICCLQLVSLTLKVAAGVITPQKPTHPPTAHPPPTQPDNYRPFH